MNNPFIGEGGDDDSPNVPLEFDDTFETLVFPTQKRTSYVNPVLIISSTNPPPEYVLSIPKDVREFLEFKNEWRTHRKKEVKKILQKTTDILKVPKPIKKAYTRNLEKNIEDFADFMLNEISPVENAFESAADQVSQMLKLITSSEIDTSQLGYIRSMLKDTVQLKFLAFFASKFNLSESEKLVLTDKYFASNRSGDNQNVQRLLLELQKVLQVQLRGKKPQL